MQRATFSNIHPLWQASPLLIYCRCTQSPSLLFLDSLLSCWASGLDSSSTLSPPVDTSTAQGIKMERERDHLVCKTMGFHRASTVRVLPRPCSVSSCRAGELPAGSCTYCHRAETQELWHPQCTCPQPKALFHPPKASAPAVLRHAPRISPAACCCSPFWEELPVPGGIMKENYGGKQWAPRSGEQELITSPSHQTQPQRHLYLHVCPHVTFPSCAILVSFFLLKQRIFLFNPCQSMQHMEGKVSKVTFKRQLGKLTCFKNPCVSSRWELAQTRRYLLWDTTAHVNVTQWKSLFPAKVFVGSLIMRCHRRTAGEGSDEEGKQEARGGCRALPARAQHVALQASTSSTEQFHPHST